MRQRLSRQRLSRQRLSRSLAREAQIVPWAATAQSEAAACMRPRIGQGSTSCALQAHAWEASALRLACVLFASVAIVATFADDWGAHPIFAPEVVRCAKPEAGWRGVNRLHGAMLPAARPSGAALAAVRRVTLAAWAAGCLLLVLPRCVHRGAVLHRLLCAAAVGTYAAGYLHLQAVQLGCSTIAIRFPDGSSHLTSSHPHLLTPLIVAALPLAALDARGGRWLQKHTLVVLSLYYLNAGVAKLCHGAHAQWRADATRTSATALHRPKAAPRHAF
jgi:hypothetical protein